MSWKQGLLPHCLLMRALCVNEQGETHCGHLTLFSWHEKQQVESTEKTSFLSAFTVITFHSKAFFTHMEINVWVCMCVTIKHIIFTNSNAHNQLFLHTGMLHTNSKLPVQYAHMNTPRLIHTYILYTYTLSPHWCLHTIPQSKMASHDTENMEKH